MKHLKITLVFGILSLQAQNSTSLSASNGLSSEDPVNAVYAKEYLWNKNYNETINFIKSHEGFRSSEYYCAAGVLTIGYGHAIKENEFFDKSLSKQEAEALLISDFDLALKAVERTTNLEGSKKLAIAHFIFSVGIGNFNRSTLKKLVNSGQPIQNSILQWSNYTNKKGVKIKSQVAYNLRKWELNMYYRDDNMKLLALK